MLAPTHKPSSRGRRTLPPQQNPTTNHFLILPPVCLLISSTQPGILGTVAGGAPGPWKKAPSFSPFSGVSGGYHSGGTGFPRKISGIKTWNLCPSSPEWARISAPYQRCQSRPSRKSISTDLDALGAEAKDVVEDENSGGGRFRTSFICSALSILIRLREENTDMFSCHQSQCNCPSRPSSRPLLVEQCSMPKAVRGE